MQQKLEINHETAHDAPAAPASSGPGPLIITAAAFLAVFILGRFLASRVELPFSNPEGIVGTLAHIRFKPCEQYRPVLLITLSPTVALAALFFMAPRKLVARVLPPPLAQISDEPRGASWRSLIVPHAVNHDAASGTQYAVVHVSGCIRSVRGGPPSKRHIRT